jgi:hypothetical protein
MKAQFHGAEWKCRLHAAADLPLQKDPVLAPQDAAIVKADVYTAVGIRCTTHTKPSIRKCWQYLRRQTAAAFSIVRSRTKATEFVLFCLLCRGEEKCYASR